MADAVDPRTDPNNPAYILAHHKGETHKQRQERLRGELAPGVSQYTKNPQKFIHGVLAGKGPAMRRLMRLRQASHDLGYTKNQETLQGMYDPAAAAAASEDPTQAGSKVEVERDFQESPTFNNFSDYIAKHINPQTGEAVGLTPDETNAIRGTGAHTINQAAQSAANNEMTRLAAAGIDPRSGLGAERAMAIQSGTQENLANLERSITDENLKRKQEFESYAQDQGRAEEQRRQFDVSGDLRRLADVERGEQDLANLGETQRQYDTSYTEAQRQARLKRLAARHAANSLKPTIGEQITSGISGLLKGVGGGGGSGGSGVMGM